MSPDSLRKIFELAKLEGSDEFIAKTAIDIDKIFSMVSEINNIDTTGIEPLAHSNNATQRLRDDTPDADIPRDKLQSIAPSTESGLYLVPTVIE